LRTQRSGGPDKRCRIGVEREKKKVKGETPWKKKERTADPGKRYLTGPKSGSAINRWIKSNRATLSRDGDTKGKVETAKTRPWELKKKPNRAKRMVMRKSCGRDRI